MNESIIFIIKKGPKFLVEQKGPQNQFSGKDLFPGGTIREGETMDQALKREALEEFNIEPIEFQQLQTEQPIIGETGKTLHPFLVTEWEGGIPQQNDERNKLIWETLDEIEQQTKIPTMKTLILLTRENINR